MPYSSTASSMPSGALWTPCGNATTRRYSPVSLENALTREEIDGLSAEGRLEEALIPLDAPLGHLPEVHVGEEARHAVLNGNPLKPRWLREPAPRGEGAVRIFFHIYGRFVIVLIFHYKETIKM